MKTSDGRELEADGVETGNGRASEGQESPIGAWAGSAGKGAVSIKVGGEEGPALTLQHPTMDSYLCLTHPHRNLGLHPFVLSKGPDDRMFWASLGLAS